MSESFIQSEYLFNQISKQFFQGKSHNVSLNNLSNSDKPLNTQYQSDDDFISESSDPSDTDFDLDESDSDNDDYIPFFLETNESGLNHEFTLCDDEPDILKEYTIRICGYKMMNTYNLPFLQYILNTQDDVLKFPEFQFKCATNIPVNDAEEYSPKHIFFQNECSKHILKFAIPLVADSIENMYKGFVKSSDFENTIYVFFDLTYFSLDNTMVELITIDEIINKHQFNMFTIDPSVYKIFYQIPDTMTIKNKWGKRIPIPFVLYPCISTENGYENSHHSDDVQDNLISIIDERVNHPYYGNIYLFSTKPLQNDISQNLYLKRYVVFCINSIYIIKTIKSNNDIDNDNDEFRLSSVIPSAISYINKPVQYNEENDDDDEEEEDVQDNEEEEKEEEDVQDNELNKIKTQNFNSIYFQDFVGETKYSFWGIKSGTQFTILL